jgi:hypothetical protein
MRNGQALVDQSFLLNSSEEADIGPRFAFVPGRAVLSSAGSPRFMVSSPMSQRCFFQTNTRGPNCRPKAKEVIRIDLEEEAVMDASRNAEKNVIDKATLITAKAEDALIKLLSEKAWNGEQIVCNSHLPPGGRHKKALGQFRTGNSVVCAPESLVHGSQGVLMAVTRLRESKSFRPTFWLGVDLFPHMDRLELLLLKRLLSADPNNISKG